jgi:thiol-disulfide isomerase/thioredoxin
MIQINKKIIIGVVVLCFLIVGWRMYSNSSDTGGNGDNSVVETIAPSNPSNQKIPPVGLYDVSYSDLKQIVTQVGKGAVIFYAPWCGHCKALKESGELEKLANTHYTFTINGDAEDLSKISELGCSEIRGFPTICKIENNKLVEISCGRTAEAIKALL